jgi:hypothetical protein
MRGLLNLLCFALIVACAVYWPAGLLALGCLTLGAIYNELTLLRRPVNELAKLFCTPFEELPLAPSNDLTSRIMASFDQAEDNRRKVTKH